MVTPCVSELLSMVVADFNVVRPFTENLSDAEEKREDKGTVNLLLHKSLRSYVSVRREML